MSKETIAQRLTREHEILAEIVANLRKAATAPPRAHRDRWLATLRERFFHYRAHMNRRIALEEIGGLYDEVLLQRPTLSGQVESLRGDHRTILATTEEIQASLQQVSADDEGGLQHMVDRINKVLADVDRHSEREDSLISFVFTQDIGGTE